MAVGIIHVIDSGGVHGFHICSGQGAGQGYNGDAEDEECAQHVYVLMVVGPLLERLYHFL